MPATWVDRSSSRGDAAKYKDLQHFTLFYFTTKIDSLFDCSVQTGSNTSNCFKIKNAASPELACLILSVRTYPDKHGAFFARRARNRRLTMMNKKKEPSYRQLKYRCIHYLYLSISLQPLKAAHHGLGIWN
jgi:hypothetical protein